MIVKVPDDFMADKTAEEIMTILQDMVEVIQSRLSHEERVRLIDAIREPKERKKQQRVQEWIR